MVYALQALLSIGINIYVGWYIFTQGVQTQNGYIALGLLGLSTILFAGMLMRRKDKGETSKLKKLLKV